jgi:hypothetical protein
MRLTDGEALKNLCEGTRFRIEAQQLHGDPVTFAVYDNSVEPLEFNHGGMVAFGFDTAVQALDYIREELGIGIQ